MIVDVSVRIGGRVVTGLQPADFEVLDNGVPQEVLGVSYGTLPIDVTLALDVGFAAGVLPANGLRKAVGEFMSALGKADRLKLLLFHSSVARSVDFTRDADVVDRVLRAVRAGQQSDLVGTLAEALASASPTDRRHLVIFVTDGGPESSATPEVLMTAAQRSRATLSMIMPIRTTSSTTVIEPTQGQRQRTDPLIALVRETGGGVTWMTANGDLARPLRRTSRTFRPATSCTSRPGASNAAGSTRCK